MRVYMDNGATTRVDPEVVEAMMPFFTERFGNASSLHSFGREAKKALDNARKTIAGKLNADPNEITFTSGGSEADNLALIGFSEANRNKGNHIITSAIEHPAVLGTCNELSQRGFEITYVPVDKDGIIRLDELRKAFTSKTIMVSIMYANNEIGTVQPIEEIARICKERGACFHTDAVQAFTKLPLDVKKVPVDMISMASHKIHGPKGVGALYIRKGTKLKKQVFGGKQEAGKRAGTENIPGIVGFARAVEVSSQKDIVNMAALRDNLIDRILDEIPDTQLNGSRTKRLCNNANIAFNFIEGESILVMLDERGIAVSTGSACSTQSLRPSHVLMSLGLPPERVHGCIRFTISKFTTQEEVDYVVNNLKEVVSKLRAMSPLTE